MSSAFLEENKKFLHWSAESAENRVNCYKIFKREKCIASDGNKRRKQPVERKRKPGGGRKKSKPEYSSTNNLQEQMEKAVDLYNADCSL